MEGRDLVLPNVLCGYIGKCVHTHLPIYLKKKDDLLDCWTSSSDISGYHPDFHEGHATVGAGQERGMACVN